MSSPAGFPDININAAVQQVRLKEQVRNFCERIGFWIEVNQNCAAFLRNSKDFDPFVVNLKIVFGDIENGDLLYLITKEPKQFEIIIDELICIFAQKAIANSGSYRKILAEQVHCNITVQDLPLIPTYIFTWKAGYINCALTTFRCIIQSIEESAQYIRQSLWKCLSCIGSPHIIHKNRKSSRKTVNCERCLKECQEVVNQRFMSKFCVARVFHAEHFNADRAEYRTAFTTELKLFDEQCQELQLGNEYIVTGVFQPYPNFYDVWSITPTL